MGLVALYALGQLIWYAGTPMGISPVLDGQENLLLAQRIAQGDFGEEPFYRSILYPAVIAYFPLGYSFLGLISHLANTWLTGRMAHLFWSNKLAQLTTMVLVGFNPVLLHFAFDPLDTTLALSFFLCSLYAGLLASRCNKQATQRLLLAACGISIALATLTRPHYLLTAAAIGILLLYGIFRQRLKPTSLASFTIALLIPLLAMGFFQKSLSGEFRILPWQGAYNLWTSNSPDANGLYYRQTLSFHSLEEHQNPNKLEGMALYRAATGETGTIDERKAYWRQRTIEHILANPWDWTKLIAFKLYASLNNFEQYNNKTFSFHKALSPYFNYNPICWGLIWSLAVFSAVSTWRSKKCDILPLGIIGLSLVAGLLMFMASGRFRLPLVPLAAILAGGVPIVWKSLKQTSSRHRIAIAIFTFLAASLSFSRFADIASTDSYLQDALLMADSAARIGADQEAIKWSGYVIEKSPQQQQALRLNLISHYNQIASGEHAATEQIWQELANRDTHLQLDDELLAYIRGVIAWNLGQNKRATQLWQSGYDNYGLNASACLAALEYAGTPVREFNYKEISLDQWRSPNNWLYAVAVAQSMSLEERAAFLQSVGVSPESFKNISESLGRVIPRER